MTCHLINKAVMVIIIIFLIFNLLLLLVLLYMWHSAAYCGVFAQKCSLYFTTAREISPQNIAPFTGVSGAHVMHGSLGPPESI